MAELAESQLTIGFTNMGLTGGLTRSCFMEGHVKILTGAW